MMPTLTTETTALSPVSVNLVPLVRYRDRFQPMARPGPDVHERSRVAAPIPAGSDAPTELETDDIGMVHILDDDPSLRRALEGLMRSVGIPAQSYETPEEFMAAKRSETASCLVLDIRMPGVNGLDFQEQLTASGDALPVIVVTGHGDVPTSVRAMKAGAVDFLSKPFRENDLLGAIRAALERSSRRLAYDGETVRVANLYQTLSPRERQIMRLVTSGLMNKQIAGGLGISEVTVKIHRKSAMRKTGARSLADLVRMADTLGLHAQGSLGEAAQAAAASSVSIRNDGGQRIPPSR